MALQTILLDPIYNGGMFIGPILTYTFVLLMTIEIIYVFVKYVMTSNK